MNVKKTVAIIIISISVINLVGLIGVFCKVNKISDKINTVEYTMYIGLNDKDTCKQEMTDDDALTTIKSIIAKYVDGYTLINSQGEWINGNGHEIEEKTIICFISGVEEATIYSIADELIIALNQETIMISKNNTKSEFYKGKLD